jgi:hypothetical protein
MKMVAETLAGLIMNLEAGDFLIFQDRGDGS